ncbi:MAG: biotin/lipoyl-binding protein, partial [Oleiphilaceae bacterium]|nr:biotin/lipoyl-binding protein [Oleiphilaceae bacterium]
MLNLANAKGTELDQSSKQTAAANDSDLLSFLPAAIEVEATPASKAGRAIIWAIVLLFSLAVAWACLGHIDIVAVAQGKVIPNERVKYIQPLEAATVQAIHVKEGQKVIAGEPLITLDSTQAQADVTRLTQELNEAIANQQRLRLFENWLAATSDHISGGAKIG